MPTVIGVKFRPVTKVYYFDPKEYADLEINAPVIVETARGLELGWVSIPAREVSSEEIKGKLKEVIRLATPADSLQMETYREKEKEALEKIRAMLAEMQLPMKIIRVEYSFDGKRLLVMFIAEQRVDFRDLVRSLIRSLHTQIEMKQIGARDEAKLINGFGKCGRELCCSSWLTEFHPVSIRMAKNQDLPLAPSEISGLCGRLLCCLAYENEQYEEAKSKMPAVGSEVVSEKGRGFVRGLNVIKESLIVELESEMLVEIPAPSAEVINLPQTKARTRKKG